MSDKWGLQKDTQAGAHLLIRSRMMIARIFGLSDSQANFIIQALNSHDELLSMLEAWVFWFRQGEKAPLYRTEIAIKNAEEK